MSAHWWDANPEALEFVKRQISEGASAAEVGVMLTAKYDRDISRNAVIGAMNRHGVKATDQRASKRGQGQRKATSDHKPRHKWSAPPQTFKTAPSSYNKDPDYSEQKCSCTIHGLNDSKCHWPLGDMQARPPFMYCGARVIEGYPYCNYHMGRSVDINRTLRYRQHRRV